MPSNVDSLVLFALSFPARCDVIVHRNASEVLWVSQDCLMKIYKIHAVYDMAICVLLVK